MRIKTALAAAALLAATAAVAPMVSATAASAAGVQFTGGFPCYGFGEGATAQIAAQMAHRDMNGDVTIGAWVYTTGQYSDGTYWEKITADCTAIR